MGRKHHKCEDKIKAKRISAEKIKTQKLSACKVTAHEVDTKSLNVQDFSIDGVSFQDYLLANSGADFKLVFDEVDPNPPQDCNWGPNSRYPKKPEKVNADVFKCLCETLNREIYDSGDPQRPSLNQRLKNGRERLNQIYPGEYEQVGDIEVVGSITFVPYYPIFGLSEDPKLKEILHFYTKVGWNVEVANTQLEDPFDPNNTNIIKGSRVGAIYLQYAYIDKETGECKSKLYDLGIRQFEPSIDYDPTEDPDCVISWGEKYMGYQSFETKAVKEMYDNMPNPDDGAAVQLVILREPGLVVYFPGGCDDEDKRVSTVVTNPNCTSNCVGNASSSVSADVQQGGK